MASLLRESRLVSHITVTVSHDYKGCAISRPRRKRRRLCNALCDRASKVSRGTDHPIWLEYWRIYRHLGRYELSFYSELGNIIRFN